MDQTVIGIDVSKAELVMAVHPSGERWTSETTAIAMDTLVARLRDLGPQLIVMEATAGYELPLAAACTAAHLPIVIVNPRQVRAFAQAIGRTAKTDVIDAAVFAVRAMAWAKARTWRPVTITIGRCAARTAAASGSSYPAVASMTIDWGTGITAAARPACPSRWRWSRSSTAPPRGAPPSPIPPY